MVMRGGNGAEEIELRDVFDEWFSSILLAQPTCLYRDVLRLSKEVMWENWKKIKPIWTSEELKQAKEEAEKLYELLMQE